MEKSKKFLKCHKQKEKHLLCPNRPGFNSKFSTQFIKVEDKTLSPIRKKNQEWKNINSDNSCPGSLMELECSQHLRRTMKVISTAWNLQTDSFHWNSSSLSTCLIVRPENPLLFLPCFTFSFPSCSREETPVAIDFLRAQLPLASLSFILSVLSIPIFQFPFSHFYCF